MTPLFLRAPRGKELESDPLEGSNQGLRLNTDYIDLYQMHNFDSFTPLEETLSALDFLMRQGKVLYIGCSNYSGWQLMKALSISDKFHYPRYISQQVYYSLLARECEYELIPLALDPDCYLLMGQIRVLFL